MRRLGFYSCLLRPVHVLINRRKPGLHVVVTIAEHACDYVLKMVSKLSIYQLQIFLVKYEYPRSYSYVKTKAHAESFKKRVRNHELAIFATYMETSLK